MSGVVLFHYQWRSWKDWKEEGTWNRTFVHEIPFLFIPLCTLPLLFTLRLDLRFLPLIGVNSPVCIFWSKLAFLLPDHLVTMAVKSDHSASADIAYRGCYSLNLLVCM
jgi:hypothetical protein